MKKQRVDILLVEQGCFDSREKAKRAIMAGIVFNGTERIDKPGMKIDPGQLLEVKGQTLRYVGRGGLKMEKALDVFHMDVTGKVILDIGASTGGFADCCLQNGARLVYALDVGYNQLAWKLRQDERVVVMERMNFRYAKPENFTEGVPSFATIDVSFISLKLIFPALAGILKKDGKVIALIKPQFEVGREEVGKKGIVRDARMHEKVVRDIVSFAEKQGFSSHELSFSPITGGNGNIEFLLYLQLSNTPPDIGESQVSKVVSDAHNSFDK